MKVNIGMGDFYIHSYEDGDTIPSDEVIETQANHLGHTKGGATVEYTPTVLEEKDDKNVTRLLAIVDEEAKFTTGILTYNTATLAKLNESELTEVAPQVGVAGKRTLKIGGRGKCGITKHILRFKKSGCETGEDLRITMVVSNQAGFSLEYLKDQATVYDAEFTAHSSDSDGTLVIIEEGIAALPTP